MSSDPNGDALPRSISGDTEVACTPSITAPGASYPLGFRHSSGQNQNRSFSRPSGARLPRVEELDGEWKEDGSLTADSSSGPY